MVKEGDLTWGSEHTIQCTDDVLQNCTAECNPNKFNKKEKKIELNDFEILNQSKIHMALNQVQERNSKKENKKKKTQQEN